MRDKIRLIFPRADTGPKENNGTTTLPKTKASGTLRATAGKAGRQTGSEAPWLHRAALKYAFLDCSQNQGVSGTGSGARGQTTLLSAAVCVCVCVCVCEFRAICPVAGILFPGTQFPLWEPRWMT